MHEQKNAMTRREFIRTSSAFIAGALLAGGIAGCRKEGWETIRDSLSQEQVSILGAIARRINARSRSPAAPPEVQDAFAGKEIEWARLLETLVKNSNMLPGRLPKDGIGLSDYCDRADSFYGEKIDVLSGKDVKNSNSRQKYERLTREEKAWEKLRLIRIRESLKITVEALMEKGDDGQELLDRMNGK